MSAMGACLATEDKPHDFEVLHTTNLEGYHFFLMWCRKCGDTYALTEEGLGWQPVERSQVRYSGQPTQAG